MPIQHVTTTPAKVPKFLRILYSILTTESQSIIAWAPCGIYFQVLNMAALETQVLPKYFKHNKFASFQRQLNNFGFRKWTKTRASVCTFSHDTLVKCKPNELAAMVSKMAITSPHTKVGGKRLRSDSSESDQSDEEQTQQKLAKIDDVMGEMNLQALLELPLEDLEVDWAVELDLDDACGDVSDMFKLDDLSVLSCDFEPESLADDDWTALLQCLV